MTKKVDLEQFAGITPGPWDVFGNFSDGDTLMFYDVSQDNEECPAIAEVITKETGAEQAKLNAAAIAAVPDLIADLKATRAREERLRTMLTNMCFRFEQYKKWYGTGDRSNDVIAEDHLTMLDNTRIEARKLLNKERE